MSWGSRMPVLLLFLLLTGCRGEPARAHMEPSLPSSEPQPAAPVLSSFLGHSLETGDPFEWQGEAEVMESSEGDSHRLLIRLPFENGRWLVASLPCHERNGVPLCSGSHRSDADPPLELAIESRETSLPVDGRMSVRFEYGGAEIAGVLSILLPSPGGELRGEYRIVRY